MSIPGAHTTIHEAVTLWPGVTAVPHRFGGVEYRLGTREIGHIHGDHLVDIPFPRPVRDAVIAAGEAAPHHILPDSGWVSRYLRVPADVATALVLLRRSYELAQQKQQQQQAVRAQHPHPSEATRNPEAQ
jgi:hypothetical protein